MLIPSCKMSPSGLRETGVGLIEVLITFVIISIGVLAILGMQVNGKKANTDAVQRTAAAHLAGDIIERMRANRDLDALQRYCNTACDDSGVVGGDTLGTAVSGPNDPPDPDCTVDDPCTPEELADLDLYQWEQSLDGQTETRGAGASTQQTGGLLNARACISSPTDFTLPDLNLVEYELILVWRGAQEQTLGGAMAAAVTAACGGDLDTTNLYGTADNPASNVYRRVLRMQFFIQV